MRAVPYRQARAADRPLPNGSHRANGAVMDETHGLVDDTRPRALALLALAPRVALELARARILLARLDARMIPRLNASAAQSGDAMPRSDRIDVVAWLVPRIARRLPWRADCLVQALAGQRCLGASGLASRVVIGAETTSAAGFSAHAWLVCGERVVTGGDVAQYTPLLGEMQP